MKEISINILIIVLQLLYQTIKSLSLCENNSPLNNLVLSTYKNYNEKINIIEDCTISKFWKVKEKYYSHQTINRVLEGKLITKRPLIFTFNDDSDTQTTLLIELSSYNIGKKKGIVNIPINKFSLLNGESFTSYLEYECINSTENNYFKFDINISITNYNKTFQIELVKICEDIPLPNDNAFDISHFFLIATTIFIIFASLNPFFESKFEKIILYKFPSTRKTKNLSILCLILVMSMYILNQINLLFVLMQLCSFCVCTLSIGVFFESLLQKTSIKTQFSTRSFEIDYIGSITMFFIVCFTFGAIISLFYSFYPFWIISDFVAIIISIETIRIFKLTHFRFILIFSFLIWIFELYIVKYKTKLLKIRAENGFYINRYDTSFPFLFIFPQVSDNKTSYKSYLYLPINEVIIPGMFIDFFYRFDKSIHINLTIYFFLSIMTFTLSFLIKILFNIYFNMYLPIFVVLFPIMFGIIIITAYFKGNIQDMMIGFSSNVFEENEIDSKKLSKMANSLYMESHGTFDGSSREMRFLD